MKNSTTKLPAEQAKECRMEFVTIITRDLKDNPEQHTDETVDNLLTIYFLLENSSIQE
jgi:hypothetical protein